MLSSKLATKSQYFPNLLRGLEKRLLWSCVLSLELIWPGWPPHQHQAWSTLQAD